MGEGRLIRVPPGLVGEDGADGPCSQIIGGSYSEGIMVSIPPNIDISQFHAPATLQ